VSSPEILGRTTAGYLLVGVFFAYEVALYFLSTRVLGWWTPSEALVHPDVLATYQPWLAAIAPSLQAGFWEESLFRAVPLACAALIGDRLGGRRWWLAFAMILQAAIFGAGHAPYATQPAYARAVELVLPSFMFGLLYLRFGLLPSIVLHFAFDVTWFALPVFVSAGAGARVSQVLIVALTLVPLGIAFGGRLGAGRWTRLPGTLRNASWTPPARSVELESAMPSAAPVSLAPAFVRALVVLGVAGLTVWTFARPFESELPALTIGRDKAASVAREALAVRGVNLDDRWWVLPSATTGSSGGRFVWETAGRERYFELADSYLGGPRWDVRAARFEGDVAERAEQWHLEIGPDGRVTDVAHTLPEARPGASLTEEEARARARAVVDERFGLAGAELEDVSADSSKRPARMDWDITFKDATVPALPRGEPRITVSLAGDEVVRVNRFVYVPDEWQREQRAEQTFGFILTGATRLWLGAVVLTGAIGAVVSWSRRRFSVRLFALTLAVFLGLSLVEDVNNLPAMLSTLSTAQPWKVQILTLVGVSVVGLAISALVFGLASGVSPRWFAASRTLDRGHAILVGASLGAFASGAMALTAALTPARGPIAGSYSGADLHLPALGATLSSLGGLVSRTALFLLVAGGVERVTRGWTTNRMLGGAALVLVGVAVAAGPPRGALEFLTPGLVAGVLLLAAYVFVLRAEPSVIVPAMGVMLVLSLAREGLYQAYPGARAAHDVVVAGRSAARRRADGPGLTRRRRAWVRGARDHLVPSGPSRTSVTKRSRRKTNAPLTGMDRPARANVALSPSLWASASRPRSSASSAACCSGRCRIRSPTSSCACTTRSRRAPSRVTSRCTPARWRSCWWRPCWRRSCPRFRPAGWTRWWCCATRRPHVSRDPPGSRWRLDRRGDAASMDVRGCSDALDVSSVHPHDRPRDVARGFAHQEHGDVGELVGPAIAVGGDRRDRRLDDVLQRRVLPFGCGPVELVGTLRVDAAGRDDVDRDAIGGHFAGERFRPAHERGAQRVRDPEVRDRLLDTRRGAREDPAPAVFAHVGQQPVREVEDADDH
jgi:hypothetical protein